MQTENIKIAIDTSDINKADNSLNKLTNTAKKTDSQFSKLVSTNDILNKSFSKSGIAITALVSGISLLAKKGIEYSASMEKLTNGLTTLNVMTSSNIASNGKAISLEEKYNIARQESIEVMKELNKINLETPHTLDETVQIYKSMYTSMKTANVSTEQMLDLTKKLSIAAGSSGIEFQQLLSGIDGLATGTVEVSSELGRFLKSIGLSNEELKKSSNIYETINNKLKDVKGIQSYDEAISNLSNSFNQLTGSLVAPFFEDIKRGINGLAGLFNELNTSVTLFYDKFKSIDKLTTVEQLNKRAIDITEKIALKKEDINNAFDFNKGKYKAELRALELELLSINQQFESVNSKTGVKLTPNEKQRNQSEITKIAGTELAKYNLTLDENIKKLTQAGATEQEINDFRVKSLKEFNDKQNKDSIKEEEKKNKELKRLEKEHQDNIKKVTKDAKDMITSDIQKLADEYVAMYSVVKDTLSEEELNRLNEAYQKKAEDLTGVTELLKQAQDIATSEIDKINDKYLKMYEVAKDNPMFSTEDMEIFFSKWNKELDDLKPKLDYSASIKLDTEGDNRAVAKITKSFDELNGATKQYQENRTKATKGSKEEAENEEQYRKDQINGYSNISNAMAEMFKDGSKEAATFQAASTALALVEATRAILTQGTGDPYTAIPRMVAMAAMVGSLMKNIGVAFGMNKTTTTSDAFSAQTTNTGSGTLLGDTKKASDSIKNSLTILKDFAKPQFQLATSMDISLKSINSKIGGVTSLLIRNAGYALGQGYTGFDTGFKNNIGTNNTMATLGAGAGGLAVAGMTGGFGAMGALSVAGPAGLALMGIDKLLLGGVVTNTIGGIVNSVLGGVFGKSSTSQALTDSGITFADTFLSSAIKELNGQAYQTIATTTTNKSWFGSSSNTSISSYFEGLNSEITNQFSLVLKNIYDTVYQSGTALKIGSNELQNNLNSFVVSIGKISLKDKTGEEIQTILSNIFSQISDDVTKATINGLGDFQAVGEGLFETLTRVATGMEQANYFVDRLGTTFETIDFKEIINKQGNVGFEALYQSILKVEKGANFNNILSTLSGTAEELYSAYLSLDLIRGRLAFFGNGLDSLNISMITGSGGLDKLSEGINSYIENFLSSSEQQSLKVNELNKQFERLGIISIPNSIQGFKDLLDSIDTTSESGSKLYGSLIALSGAFSNVYSSVESDRKSLFTSIDNFVKELRGTSDNATTTFKDFATSFNLMVDAIASGSSDVSTLGSEAITSANDYIASVTKNARTQADIDFAKQVVANKFSAITQAPDITLGTINDTLKISFNENSVIVNELKQMREQLSYLNNLNTTQTATQLKTLSATRALIS